MLSESLHAGMREGDIGTPLAEIARADKNVMIGSYPFSNEGRPDTHIVVRSRDAGALVLREPGGGYGAACQRAQAHFSTLPRVPDVVVFVPGDRPAAATAVADMIAPIAARGLELVLGIAARHRGVAEKLALGLIDTVYRHRWSGVGPVRAIRFPALVALGMRDRGDGWDVEMLVRAVKLGLSCDEIPLPDEARAGAKVGGRALFHILRHATMR